MNTGNLGLAESIELAHAMVDEVAARSSSRILFIKGLSLEFHGLRPSRTPADVDVLVHPDDFEALCRGLEEWGWRERMSRVVGRGQPHHSTTFLHPQWPCDIDVHLWFPGFLAPSDEVFGQLRRRSGAMTVAARRVPVPDLTGGALILALHSLRSTPENPRHASELRHLIELVRGWDKAERDDLACLARHTGCAQSLTPFWELVGLEVGGDHTVVSAVDLAQWQMKIDGRSSGLRVWADHIRAGGPGLLLRRVCDAVWLDEAVLRGSQRIPPGRLALTSARLRRLGRGVVRLPFAVVRSVRGGRSVAKDVALRG